MVKEVFSLKYLPQLCVILLFSFLGELCHYLIPLPIPASIYGMALLFLALALRIVPGKLVKDVGGFLTGILPVLFVAPIVGLLDCWDTIRDAVLPITIIVLISTLLVFAVSGWVTQLLLRREKGDGNHD